MLPVDMTPEEMRRIMLAEYTALRGEITAFLALQGQFMNYSIVLSGIIAGLALKSEFRDTLQAPPALAFLPIPFLILGILYTDVRARVLRAAEYIETELRPNLPFLGWESFIRKPHKLTKFWSGAEHLRSLIFLLPVSIFVFLLIANWHNPGNPTKPSRELLRWIFVGLDGVLLVTGVWSWAKPLQ
jgi:hypothetical protein